MKKIIFAVLGLALFTSVESFAKSRVYVDTSIEFTGIMSVLNTINELGLDYAEVGREVIAVEGDKMAVYFISQGEGTYARYDYDLNTGENLNTGCAMRNIAFHKEAGNQFTILLEGRALETLNRASESREIKIVNMVNSLKLNCEVNNALLFRGIKDN